jgi:putative DNA primase/helicase
MADLTRVLNGPWEPREKTAAPIDVQFISAIASSGMTPPDVVYMDGKIHRFNPSGKTGGDKSGWYLVFQDGIPAGRFGCWKLGLEQSWRADIGRALTVSEEATNIRRMEEAKKMRDAELEKKHEVAADTVEKIWVNGGAASDEHPYLKSKGVGANGSRITGDGRLMVPLYSKDGAISSIQYIDAEGGKLYHPGGATGGMFWMVGAHDEPGIMYIAEGFATAATIHEATRRPCVVAYSASNLVPVTAAIVDLYGEKFGVVIVADNDASGVGLRYAEQASAKFGVRFVMPPILGDANDYAQSGHDLFSLLSPQLDHSVVEKLQTVFGDQLPLEYEPPDELVEGLITTKSLVVLYGDSNSGKTFWALSVAAAIATGGDCYGRRTEHGLVVYLASEAPGSVKSRVQAMKKYHGVELENLAIIQVPMNFHVSDQDSNDVMELVRAVEEIKGMKVKMVIGDTLARISSGANENSGEDMGPVIDRFGRIASTTGAAVVLIHHTGKDAAKGARGWSGLRAYIETELEASDTGGSHCVKIMKQRDLPSKGESIYFKLDIVEMGVSKFGSTVTTCVAIPDENGAENEPETKKKESKLSVHLKLFERAWWDSGAEIRNGLPYLSRSALKNKLEKDGHTERTIRNYMNPSYGDKLVGALTNEGCINCHEHGWILCNEVYASVLLISKNTHVHKNN